MHWPDYVPKFTPDPMEHIGVILEVLEGDILGAQEAINGLEQAGFDPEYCERLRWLMVSRGEC